MKKWIAFGLSAFMVLMCVCASADAFVDDGYYAAFCGILDSNLGDNNPVYSYDESTKVMTVILSANLGGVDPLLNGTVDSSVWQSILDGQNDTSEIIHSGMADIGIDVTCVITMVEVSGDTPIVMLVSCNGYTAYDIAKH